MKFKKVKVFSTPKCPYCDMEKQFLRENSIPFEGVNVAQDELGRRELVQKSGNMSVPVTVVEMGDGSEQVIIGFNRLKLKQLLGIK